MIVIIIIVVIIIIIIIIIIVIIIIIIIINITKYYLFISLITIIKYNGNRRIVNVIFTCSNANLWSLHLFKHNATVMRSLKPSDLTFWSGASMHPLW